jgi:hypothetical protein
MNPLHRDAWRALPLQEVIRPTLDAPTLAFPERHELTAVLLLEKLVVEHRRYRRAFRPEARKAHGIRMRKLHLARVSLAIGVKLPGHPHVIHEFAQ